MVGGSAQHEKLYWSPMLQHYKGWSHCPSRRQTTELTALQPWLPRTTLGISYAKVSKARASGSAEQRLRTWFHVPDKTTGEPNIRTAGAAEAYKTVAANSEVLTSLPYYLPWREECTTWVLFFWLKTKLVAIISYIKSFISNVILVSIQTNYC